MSVSTLVHAAVRVSLVSCWLWLQLKKTLVGVKVEVTHRGDERRKYRISGITNQPLAQLR